MNINETTFSSISYMSLKHATFLHAWTEFDNITIYMCRS